MKPESFTKWLGVIGGVVAGLFLIMHGQAVEGAGLVAASFGSAGVLSKQE